MPATKNPIKKQGRKIFLDVGAYQGESLAEVIKDDYLFDVIHCFEPMPAAFSTLRKFVCGTGAKSSDQNSDTFLLAGKTIILNNFGLSDRMGERMVYGSDAYASLMGAPRRVVDDFESSHMTSCRFVMVSDYFRQHISDNDVVVMKMNCEGAEIEIMKDLLASGEIFKIDSVMIDFDAFKIEGMQHEPRKLLKKFRAAGFHNYALRFEVMRRRDRSARKSHEGNMRNWLEGLSFAKTIMKNPHPFNWRRRFDRWLMRHIKRRIKMLTT